MKKIVHKLCILHNLIGGGFYKSLWRNYCAKPTNLFVELEQNADFSLVLFFVSGIMVYIDFKYFKSQFSFCNKGVKNEKTIPKP